MESLARFGSTPPPPLFSAPKKARHGAAVQLRACRSSGTDPLLESAIRAASLRFHETNRPEPLVVDPYAGCFITSGLDAKPDEESPHYCLSTRYIDDKLLRTVNHTDDLKQVVLLTDGLDTRPYRLKWPYLTVMFDISPDRVFQTASKSLKDAGAKVPRSCVFVHVPSELSIIQEALYAKGFSGSRPSIWAIQGFPVTTLANFEDILSLVSAMAMEGSYFLGELPAWLAGTEMEKPDLNRWIDKLFLSNGLKVKILNHDDIAKNLGKEPASGDYGNILFVAEQLRLSDGQMETWRNTSKRIEEDGDEDGFEEL